LNEQLTGVRISRQVFGIAKRIWQVNRLITPAHQGTIREGHPELSFALMNGCWPLLHHKTTTEGRQERRELLLAAGVPKFDTEEWRSRLPGTALDDIIDAAAMLWTAARVARRTAVRLPAEATRPDGRGLDMAIWA
jgi:predicted RNase H-like nuclease